MQLLGNFEEWLHAEHIMNFKKDGLKFLTVFAELRKRSKINKDNLSKAAVLGSSLKTHKRRTEKRLIVIISSAVFNYVINNFWKNNEEKKSWNENCNKLEFKGIGSERKTSRRQGYSNIATKNTKHITHNWMVKLERICVAILRLLTPNQILRLLRTQRGKVKIIVRETSDSSGGCASLCETTGMRFSAEA